MNPIGLARAVALLLLALGYSTPALSQSRPPVEAFGSLPVLDRPQLSPDGLHLAMIQSVGGRPAAVIYKVGTGAREKPVVIPSDEWLVDGIRWAKNDRLIVFLGKSQRLGEDEHNLLHSFQRAVSVSVEGTDGVILLKNNGSMTINTSSTLVSDLAPNDPDNVYMPIWLFADTLSPSEEARRAHQDVSNYSTYFHYNMYRVNVRTGKGTQVQSGDADTKEWFMDGHGNVVARLDITPQRLLGHLKVLENNSWREIGSYDASKGHGPFVAGLSDDGKGIVRLDVEASRYALVRHDLATGAETTVFGVPEYDLAGVIVDEWTGRVVGVAYVTDSWQYHYFDAKRQALQSGLEAAFPGRTVVAVSTDFMADKVIASVESPRMPPEFYFVDRTTHEATPVGKSYPGLSEADLGEIERYPYVARDGTNIPAYLTLPPGGPAKNLPAIVMPHGGPDSRNSMTFDWWAQFLANRGYVVLQPNYRGSFGYGRTFADAGLQQWGLKMQDDITDGVKKMIADGIADPKRICIVGGSYGGYAALAGAAFTPNLYACAVSVAGVSDLPKMLATERLRYGKDSTTSSFWISRIGSPYDDSEQLRATSPARHADQVKCPVLLMHGTGDTTVGIDQSEAMEDALKSAGKDVQFVKFEGDDHYLELASTRIAMLTEIEKFLKAHIGD